MSSIYRRTFYALLFAASLSVLTGFAAGTPWGLAVFAVLLGVLYARHVRHLALLERWLVDPSAPVPEGLGSWDDILTALYRYQRSAAARERLLAGALSRFGEAAQALPEGVVILDGENRIEWCNRAAAAQLGLDPSADTRQGIANLIREPAFVDYLASGRFEGATIRITRGGALLSLQLVPYGESQKLLLSRDVTQADRVETMRRDFVANVSHELRTPLTVLVGFLETVRELKLDPQRVSDYLAMMQEQSSRMQRIIEDLLTLSQLESSPPPALEHVPVLPLLQRLKGDAEALSGGRHRVVLDARPTLALLGSERELASAFGNLVTNAVRYTPAGGDIVLTWQEGADGASFRVADTGAGILPEHLPRLTERFYRVDRSRSRETGGTGLGLAIVKHAVARHEATLEIESKPGAGSRFTVCFPRERTAPLERPAVQEPR